MNTIVSLPIAAALPVAAPAMTPTTTPDAELLELVEKFISAEAEACRLNRIWDHMPKSGAEPPTDLKIRADDADLGIPRSGKPHPSGYYCGLEVKLMREPKWVDHSRSDHVVTDDASTVTVRYLTPSPAARARADAIVAAYEKTQNRKSRAYRAAERAKDKAFELSDDLKDQINEVRATSIPGLIAKARCLEALEYDDSDLTGSIVNDLLAMAKTSLA